MRRTLRATAIEDLRKPVRGNCFADVRPFKFDSDLGEMYPIAGDLRNAVTGDRVGQMHDGSDLARFNA